MNVLQHKIESLHLGDWIASVQHRYFARHFVKKQKSDLLSPLRQWLDNMEIKSSNAAHRICKSIPSQCPFEREVKFFGRTIAKIPPMCKLNPLYNEVVYLRFRAMSYLADVCGEDVSIYC